MFIAKQAVLRAGLLLPVISSRSAARARHYV